MAAELGSKYHYNYRIVTEGGGTGQYAAIKGLKDLNNPDLMTAVTAPTDSGGSSGGLRSELEVLPPGDNRRCLLAFAPSELHQSLISLFQFRFPEDTPWAGHNPINIELAALELIYGPEGGIKEFQKIHGIPGHILPVSITKTDLRVKLSDGSEIIGETNIDLRYERNKEDYDPSKKIEYVALTNQAFSNPNVLSAIDEADIFVFPPGDLYTSILPHLLVDNLADAIVRSKAKKVFCCNIMTKPGETDSFKASEFLSEMIEYLGDTAIDLAIFNNNSLPDHVKEYYARENQYPVEIDLDECQRLLPHAIIRAVDGLAKYSKHQRVVRHYPPLLAETILSSAKEIESTGKDLAPKVFVA